MRKIRLCKFATIMIVTLLISWGLATPGTAQPVCGDDMVPPGQAGDDASEGSCCIAGISVPTLSAGGLALLVFLLAMTALWILARGRKVGGPTETLVFGACVLALATAASADCCLCNDGSAVALAGIPANCVGLCGGEPGNPLWSGMTFPNHAGVACDNPCSSALVGGTAPAGDFCGETNIGYVESLGRRCDTDLCYDDVYACSSKGCVGGANPGDACECAAQCDGGTCEGVQGVCVNVPGGFGSLGVCGANSDCPQGESCISQHTCRQFFVHECSFGDACAPGHNEAGAADGGACPAGITNVVCP